MPKIKVRMPNLHHPVYKVNIGDLVRVPIYKSIKGELMAASPDWVSQPNAHNSPPRTQIVSALVVDSRRRKSGMGAIESIEILVGDERIQIPTSCVMEVVNRDARKIKY